MSQLVAALTALAKQLDEEAAAGGGAAADGDGDDGIDVAARLQGPIMQTLV